MSYFSHDHNAHNDEKILFIRSKYGAEGYGLYWYFIEKLHDSPDSTLTCNLLEGLAWQLNVDITLLKQFYNDAITIGLFVSDGEKYWSERVLKNKQIMNEKRLKKSLAGKKGMENRWSDNIVITEHNSVITEHNKIKENKIKENKINIKFISPHIEDIKNEFCLVLDDFTAFAEADKFFNYYESNGWMVGRSKMKNWKAAVKNWISNRKKYTNEPTSKAESRIDKIQQLRTGLYSGI